MKAGATSTSHEVNATTFLMACSVANPGRLCPSRPHYDSHRLQCSIHWYGPQRPAPWRTPEAFTTEVKNAPDPSERICCTSNSPCQEELLMHHPGTKAATAPPKAHTCPRPQSHSCSTCSQTSGPDYVAALHIPMSQATPLRANKQCPRRQSCCLYKHAFVPVSSSMAA